MSSGWRALLSSFQELTVAEAYLRLLKSRGIDYLFANAGTDFAPILEAYAKSADEQDFLPIPVTVPHENVAIHMALGYWLATRRMQAVMVHVNVGTANAALGIINAARANIPVFFAAGRTPINEKGAFGSRNLHVHWSQEMFDQASMVREFMKWDYELRGAQQLRTIIERALAVADTHPKGPVYLTLPREVLASSATDGPRFPPCRQFVPSEPQPDPRALDEAARLLRAAHAPLIITSSMGFDAAAPDALANFSECFGVPVVHFNARCLAIPTTHPMHAGFDPVPWLASADLVFVLECAVPWIPEQIEPRSGAKVVHVAVDPLYQRLPVRGFESDLSVTGMTSTTLALLGERVADLRRDAADDIERRRAEVAEFNRAQAAKRKGLLDQVRTQVPIHPAWASHCLNEAKGGDSIVLKEAPLLAMSYMSFDDTEGFYMAGAAGGLGWGMGAAVGAKMGSPDRLVIAVEGDGSYMFCEPVSAHCAALGQDTPFLTVVLDNQRWNEVRASTLHMYPAGDASQAGAYEPLTHFHKGLKLEKVVESVGGYGERVTDPSALPGALARAIRIVKEERRQVVLDIVCSG